jgi:hypothetical protein
MESLTPDLACFATKERELSMVEKKTLRHQGRTTGAMHASQTRTQSYKNKY